MTIDRIWYILGKKLSGEASKEELEELTRLLRHHPELHYPIQNITDLWQLKQKPDQSEAFEALQRHLLRIADEEGKIPSYNEENYSRGKRFSLLSKKSIAAYAVAATLAAIVFFYFQVAPQKAKVLAEQKATHPDNINEISTRAGSHSKVVLPDGSSVWLNGNSKLVYNKNFDKEIREVELIGEAYFDVTKNPQRPFIIHTRKMDIKVLGTAFNVKSYPDDKSSETSLIHGSIEVTMKAGEPGRKIILKPTEKLVVTDDNAAVSTSSDNIIQTTKHLEVKLSKINYLPVDSTVIETSWIDNRLVFRDKPFVDLVVDMERRYGVAFRFQKPEAGNLMFSGNFKNETVEQVLKALQLANSFSYQNIKDTIVITK
ncbi:MAG: FecR family protein [Agriterribacter sp.]